MKLSNQAIGAIMMALQNSLLNQTDIVPTLQEWELEAGPEGLVVKNPPTVSVPDEVVVFTESDEPAVTTSTTPVTATSTTTTT
jgi:hypothetical protein